MKATFKSNLFIMLVILTQIFGGFLLRPIFYGLKLPVGIILVLGQLLLLLFPVVLYFVITKEPFLKTIRFNRISPIQILLIIGIAIFIQPAAQLIGILSNFISKNYIGNAMEQINSLTLITKFGIVALTPAICEELVIRGVAFSGYRKKDIRISAIITGLFFGILHLNLQQFFYAFALGVLLAYIVYITNSIIAAMVCHFTFNGFQLLLQFIAAKIVVAYNIKVPSDITKFTSVEKLQLVLGELFWVFLITPVAFAFIYLLRRVSLKRNSIIYGELESFEKTNIREVLNWPFFVIILTFIFYLVYIQFR